jgi:hypothetical protein
MSIEKPAMIWMNTSDFEYLAAQLADSNQQAALTYVQADGNCPPGQLWAWDGTGNMGDTIEERMHLLAERMGVSKLLTDADLLTPEEQAELDERAQSCSKMGCEGECVAELPPPTACTSCHVELPPSKLVDCRGGALCLYCHNRLGQSVPR